MDRLSVFYTGAALILVWLYLSLSTQPINGRRSLSATTSNWIQPEESKLKGCFPWSVYYLQSLEFKDDSVICRGNLRKAPDIAYSLIRDNVKETFGDRFLVLLQEEAVLGRYLTQYSDRSEPEETKYVFVITPNFDPQFSSQTNSPSNSLSSWSQVAPHLEWLKWLASAIVGLLLLGGFWIYNWDVKGLDRILEIVPTLVIVLGIKELVRRWVANRYGIKVSLPYFTPHLGGIIWHKSHIPHRQALFDLAIAPNLVSLLIGIMLVAIGMLQPMSQDISGGIEFDFKMSLLMSGLNQVLSNFLPSSELNLNETGQFLHPLAYTGWWCLNLTALSLIPVSILDGGYILRSMTRADKIAIAAPIARIVILGLGLVSQQWLIVVAIELFLLSYPQALPLNDVTELNLTREIFGIAVLGIGLATILPVPMFLFQ